MFYQSQIKLFSQNLHLIKQQLLQLNIGIHDGDITACDMECDKLNQCVFCFVFVFGFANPQTSGRVLKSGMAM